MASLQEISYYCNTEILWNQRRSMLKSSTSVRWEKYQEKDEDGHMSTQWAFSLAVHKDLRGKFMDPHFSGILSSGECMRSGICRSIYFYILILMPDLWQSLVSKETEGGYYEIWDLNFFPLFQCSVSMKHKDLYKDQRAKCWWNTLYKWSVIQKLKYRLAGPK